MPVGTAAEWNIHLLPVGKILTPNKRGRRFPRNKSWQTPSFFSPSAVELFCIWWDRKPRVPVVDKAWFVTMEMLRLCFPKFVVEGAAWAQICQIWALMLMDYSSETYRELLGCLCRARSRNQGFSWVPSNSGCSLKGQSLTFPPWMGENPGREALHGIIEGYKHRGTGTEWDQWKEDKATKHKLPKLSNISNEPPNHQSQTAW